MYDLIRVDGQYRIVARGTAEAGVLVCVMTEEEVMEWGWGDE